MPFQHGLFGCFDNVGLCVITYFVPCYTYGKNAESVGENCLLCGLVYFVPILNFIFHTVNRGKIRTQRNIEGGFLTDCLAAWFCPCCALVQEAQEVQGPHTQYVQRT
ncbi:unnamed protein product [Candidula unifasciata]|uniref:Uncharacterized protein n=1 Tax=Candidula unifasciata TaxID=100452 RepID=A0A8S3YJ83_9EUPU|nr:unnamed protein product [Candidula unifasciata]